MSIQTRDRTQTRTPYKIKPVERATEPGGWWSGLEPRGRKAFKAAFAGYSLDAFDLIILTLTLAAIGSTFGVGKGATGALATVTLRLRFDDFSRATRSHTIAEATARTEVILFTARELLAVATPLIEQQGITLIGVALGNLADDRAVQLALPFEGYRASALDTALDAVRDRFGTSAITRAALLGRDPGFTMPMLPD